MPFRKEGANVMLPEGIEDRYDIVRILRETAATAVLLVNYKKIGALRILKAIHKSHPEANSILSEAHLLQGINSSQIPTIYSVEETNKMYYLVEEYVEGQTLREYLLDTKLSKEELIRLAISLCDVIEALHSAKEGAVLYRDMKPEHIILQNDGLRLIDFGISVRKSEAAKAKPLGTKNWAAPEQLNGKWLDERCDIYSVGKIIEFMQKNSYAKDDYRLKRLIRQATNVDINKRTASISELKNQLYDLQNFKNKNKSEKEHLEKNIAVVGSDHSAGTTLIAINMCRYLNKRKLNAYYRDVEGDTVHNLWSNLEAAKVKEGVLYHEYFKGILNYGEAIKKYTPPKGVHITDCGTNVDKAMDSDIVIFITSMSPMKKHDFPGWIKSDSVYIICNFSSRLESIKLAKKLHKKVYMYPLLQSIKRLEKEEERIFSTILQNEKDFKL